MHDSRYFDLNTGRMKEYWKARSNLQNEFRPASATKWGHASKINKKGKKSQASLADIANPCIPASKGGGALRQGMSVAAIVWTVLFS